MKASKWLIRPMVLAVGGCFGAVPAWANPTGPQVVSGAAQFHGLGKDHLKVTNSPSAIIHWQGFSIGAGQVTNFVQQSASSAVLNRVVGADISQIHGSLVSNGRVFLINPAGIAIGASGVIDTAGFVGSTLNMLDADFLAGKLKFSGDASSGSVVNRGWIKAGSGGNVVLVAPHIENAGVIESDGGQLVLAAGRKLTIGSLDLEGVEFEIQAPSDSALNVGKLLADGGAVGVFAGTLKHSGDIRAGALARDEAGRVVLKAQSDVIVAPGSTTTANANAGGDVVIQSDTGDARIGGAIAATGRGARGGNVSVLGERVLLTDGATVDASGASGGGRVLIGGDYQGASAGVKNAKATFVGPSSLLRADATNAGDGGRIIVWSDKSTAYFGELSARGGPGGGNGGFAEVSGKESLVFLGGADLAAPKGLAGDLLLDPLDLFVDARGGFIASLIDEVTDFAGNAVTVSPTTVASIAGNVALFASRYLRINAPIALAAGRSLTATVPEYTESAAGGRIFIPAVPDDPATPGDQSVPAVLEGTPPNRLDLAASITTAGGAVTLSAPQIQTFSSGAPAASPEINTSDGNVTLTASNGIFPGAFPALNVNARAGVVNITSDASSVSVGNVTAGSFTASGRTGITTNDISTTGNTVQLTSRFTEPDGDIVGGSIFTGAITTTGGNVTADARFGITVGNTQTSGGAFALDSMFSSVTTGSVDTGGGGLMVEAAGSISLANSFGQSAQTGGGIVLLDAGGAVNTRGIAAGAGNVTIRGNQISTNAGGAIDTSGIVSLTARPNSFSNINTRVDRASSVTASAQASGSPFGQARVTLTSTTALNVESATATASAVDCRFDQACPTSGITLSSSGGNVGIGTLTATAPVFTNRFGSQSLTEFVTVSTSGAGNSIVALPGGGQVTARNVTLSTDLLSGGGIGSIAAPLNVDAQRAFTFSPNGAFGVRLNSAGTVNLNANIGVAASGTYTGQLTRDGLATPWINVTNADTATVTAGVEIPDGFNQRVLNADAQPSFSLIVPNGGLSLTSASVPMGATAAQGSLGFDVTLRARDDVVVAGYTRGGVGVAESLAKNTTITSDDGSVILGRITANKDTVQINANTNGSPAPAAAGPGNISFSTGIAQAGIETSGNINFDASGNVTLHNVVTSAGSITVAVDPSLADTTIGNVFAPDAGAGFEASAAGGTITIDAERMGDATAPLNLAASRIRLNTRNSASRIGDRTGGGVPVPLNAATPDLGINVTAGQSDAFEVDTGSVGLVNLTIDFNNNTGGASGGRVTSQGTAYDFNGIAGSFTFAPPVPIPHFGGGLLKLTTSTGSVVLDQIQMPATAGIEINAVDGTITGGEPIEAQRIDLEAATSGTNGTRGVAQITIGDIGSAAVPVNNLTLTAGRVDAGCCGDPGRPANVTTGAITTTDGGTVTITTRGGDINIGAGTGTIGGAGATLAGSVSLHAERVGTGAGSTGTAETGDIRANTISLRAGSQGAPFSIEVGNLDGRTISFVGSSGNASVQVNGAIGATTPVRSLTGSDLSEFNVTGAVSGAPDGDAGQTNTINISAGSIAIGGAITMPRAGSTIFLNTGSGPLTLGPGGVADIVAGDGSAITLTQGTNPFTFSQLNAGATGTVSITSSNTAVQQTGGTGITAANVTFSSGSGNINRTDGDNLLDLSAVKNLTLTTSGNVAFDANGSVLDTFTFTKNATNSTFTLQGLDPSQSIVIANGATAVNANVTSTTNPLDFTLTVSPGGIDVTGIMTSGGSVVLAANGANGAINAAGSIIDTTAAPDPDSTRGGVKLTATGGLIALGTVIARPSGRTGGGGAAAGHGIAVTTTCASCGISVNGDLTTDVDGGSIRLAVDASGDITRTAGTITSQAPATVIVQTNNGNIGAAGAGNALQIDSPSVTLRAQNTGPAGGSLTAGNVFADILDTTAATTINLDLTAHNGFTVTSTKDFDVLAVATRGTGTGTLSLTGAPNQTHAFARPVTDLFTNPITNTFEVVTSAGTGATPQHPTRITFTAADGDLLVRGGANLTATNLVLEATANEGSIKLQGNDGAALALNNGGEQQFIAGRHIDVRNKATITGGTQTFRARNGDITFVAGSLNGEAISVQASERQLIETLLNGTGFNGDILLSAGSGNDSVVSVAFTGTNPAADIEQQIQARGNLALTGGGAGTGSFSEIRSGAQRQRVRANGNILLTGGDGVNAPARIVNSGDGNQQVGENFHACSFCNLEPYQTNSIVLQGGGGSGSHVEIMANGPQQIRTEFGPVSVLGGTAQDAFARIEALGSGEQFLGQAQTFGQRRIGALRVEAGSGSGAFARVRAPNTLQNIASNSTIDLQTTTNAASLTAQRQSISAAGRMTLTANAVDVVVESTGTAVSDSQSISVSGLTMNASAATDADALILAMGPQSVSSSSTNLNGGGFANAVSRITTQAAADLILFGNEQTISLGNPVGGRSTMEGGTANGAFVLINALNGDQSVSWSTLTMTGGTAAGSNVKIQALNGSQTLSGSSMTLQASGDNTTPVANAGAIIEGRDQRKTGSSGTITLIGGAGTAGAGNSSDVLIRNLAGSQDFRGDRIELRGGFHDSTVQIVNAGTGTQQVIADSTQGIFLTGRATGAGADVRIHNSAATQQTVNSTRSNADAPFTVQNDGIGIVDVRSEGSQSIRGAGGIFVTANTGADASITSAASQTFNPNFNANIGGVTVTSNNTGNATIAAGTSQTFTNITGAMNVISNAAGSASIAAQSQTISVANGVNVISNAGGNASITSQTSQAFTSGNGAMSVTAAASGAAGISAETTQTINAQNGINVTSTGSGDASIAAKMAQVFTSSNGGISLNATSSGDSALTTDTTQRFTSQFVDVVTAANSSGNAQMIAGGNQWLHTTNGASAPTGGGSMRVAALGTGVASIDAGARQLLEVDYPEFMNTVPTAPGTLIIGATDAVGTSRIQGVDQNIFTRALTVQGGTAGSSKLTGTNTQTISVLDGLTSVIAGAGANAAIDPVTQVMVLNNSNGATPVALAVTGGGAPGATASVTSTGTQSVAATRGDVNVTSNAAAATIQSPGAQTLLIANALNLAANAAGVAAQITTAAAQNVTFGALTMIAGGAAGANTIIDSTGGTQTVTGGNATLTGNAAGARAEIAASGDQTLSLGNVVLNGGGIARITTPAAQTFSFTGLQLNPGGGDTAAAQVHAGGAQTLTANGGNVMLNGTAGGGTALVDSDTSQVLNASNMLVLNAGDAPNATARMRSGGSQTLNFNAFMGTAGAANGAFIKVDAAGTQTLNGGAGNIELMARGTEAAPLSNASATIDGHSQTLVCGNSCGLIVTGGAGTSLADGSRTDAELRNLSGAQLVTAGMIMATGGHQFSWTGIDNNPGAGAQTGTQTLTATNGPVGISLTTDPDAHVDASVAIRNVPATAQIVTAANGQILLNSRGAGSVEMTSGGSQSIEGVALDVITTPGNNIQNGANTTVSAAGAQTIHTTGSLSGPATGVGMRVASRSSGAARVQSAGDQTLNIDNQQLLIGRLDFGPPGPGDSTSGSPAAGDSRVLATSEVANPNQTVVAGSIYIQGRTLDSPVPVDPLVPCASITCSKLGADGVQMITTNPGGITLIGGSGANAMAVIDPTNQTITSVGDILMQGGSGENADALILATGPQTIRSEDGSVTLIGGTGQGADALIRTDSPFQTVSGHDGVFVQQGPPGGGTAGFQQGTDFAAIGAAATSSTSEIISEQEELEELREDLTATAAETGEEAEVAKVALCS